MSDKTLSEAIEDGTARFLETATLADQEGRADYAKALELAMKWEAIKRKTEQDDNGSAFRRPRPLPNKELN